MRSLVKAAVLLAVVFLAVPAIGQIGILEVYRVTGLSAEMPAGLTPLALPSVTGPLGNHAAKLLPGLKLEILGGGGGTFLDGAPRRIVLIDNESKKRYATFSFGLESQGPVGVLSMRIEDLFGQEFPAWTALVPWGKDGDSTFVVRKPGPAADTFLLRIVYRASHDRRLP